MATPLMWNRIMKCAVVILQGSDTKTFQHADEDIKDADFEVLH